MQIAPQHFGFLLLPNFTHIGFTAASEPLRMANMASGRTLFQISTLSEDGAPVAASSHVNILPDAALAAAPPLDAVFVIGSNPLIHDGDRAVLCWLQRQARAGVALGGVCTGSYTLARAGLLKNFRCTIHWEDMGQFVERFPHIIISPNLFEIDRDRYTCSGGTAPVDMMLALIARGPGGDELAAAVAELMVCERIRGGEERQRMPMKVRLGGERPRLSGAVALMEANIEEPLEIDDLARLVGVSRRQLERLFHDHLGTTLTRYYLRLRLEQARRLLRQSEHSITEIALECGFNSLSYFGARYHTLFGCPPRAERQPSHS